jgi:hypothetical protein
MFLLNLKTTGLAFPGLKIETWGTHGLAWLKGVRKTSFAKYTSLDTIMLLKDGVFSWDAVF